MLVYHSWQFRLHHPTCPQSQHILHELPPVVRPSLKSHPLHPMENSEYGKISHQLDPHTGPPQTFERNLMADFPIESDCSLPQDVLAPIVQRCPGRRLPHKPHEEPTTPPSQPWQGIWMRQIATSRQRWSDVRHWPVCNAVVFASVCHDMSKRSSLQHHTCPTPIVTSPCQPVPIHSCMPNGSAADGTSILPSLRQLDLLSATPQ